MINTKKLDLKLGDPVYWGSMKGEVERIGFDAESYPITVYFQNGESCIFTIDGYEYNNFKECQLPLSLTPYTVELKGYSNTPPPYTSKTR